MLLWHLTKWKRLFLLIGSYNYFYNFSLPLQHATIIKRSQIIRFNNVDKKNLIIHYCVSIAMKLKFEIANLIYV